MNLKHASTSLSTQMEEASNGCIYSRSSVQWRMDSSEGGRTKENSENREKLRPRDNYVLCCVVSFTVEFSLTISQIENS